ncbi:MAG: peptidylprolyl isomerase [Desulfobacterales bacterium]|jgi:FKBP-type peptidyl-prolyl cis-trans isomerase 2
MVKAKTGDTVKIHFTGKMQDDKVVETSKERGPLEFKIGEGNVISGLEQGIIGMQVGDKKTLTISPQEAFGVPRQELMVELNKDEIPEGIKLAVGIHLDIQASDGQTFKVKVVDVKEDTITLDANHPLAGVTLIFDVELIEIV